jgi:hypothetical protein
MDMEISVIRYRYQVYNFHCVVNIMLTNVITDVVTNIVAFINSFVRRPLKSNFKTGLLGNASSCNHIVTCYGWVL